MHYNILVRVIPGSHENCRHECVDKWGHNSISPVRLIGDSPGGFFVSLHLVAKSLVKVREGAPPLEVIGKRHATDANIWRGALFFVKLLAIFRF